jgi:hypothetical protein
MTAGLGHGTFGEQHVNKDTFSNLGTVVFLERKFSLKDAIGFYGCWLPASVRSNGMHLWSTLSYRLTL